MTLLHQETLVLDSIEIRADGVKATFKYPESSKSPLILQLPDPKLAKTLDIGQYFTLYLEAQ